MTDRDCARIDVVGLVGGNSFDPRARLAIDDATVVVGSSRQLELAQPGPDAQHMVLTGSLDAVFDAIVQRRANGARVCVLASGDPGFFGIVRVLAERFGADALAVYPAPSAISLAFARLGCGADAPR